MILEYGCILVICSLESPRGREVFDLPHLHCGGLDASGLWVAQGCIYTYLFIDLLLFFLF